MEIEPRAVAFAKMRHGGVAHMYNVHTVIAAYIVSKIKYIEITMQGYTASHHFFL